MDDLGMNKTFAACLLSFITAFSAGSLALGAAVLGPIPLWPKGAPDEKGEVGEEHDTTKPDGGLVAGQRVIRLGNVSQPTITLYRPPKEKDTGAAVLVCPGGGYAILAMDLEGTEVCEWLNSIGVTGVLLKYRVPTRSGDDQHLLPLQDAQRALGLVRFHARQWKLEPARIGVLGFSAGGHLTASLSTRYDERAYPPVDAADEVSCRPDFSMPIYPAYLAFKDRDHKLAPDLHVTTNTPPTFLIQAQDDGVGVENSLFYYLALKQAKVPAELHLYASGGHGYGLRPSTQPITTWPKRAEEWMRSLGVIK
jgi:acetyl esterase/lipase